MTALTEKRAYIPSLFLYSLPNLALGENMQCECRWLRYTPLRTKDEDEQKRWTCLLCGAEYDVIAIRQRILDGIDVNELSLVRMGKD